MSGVQVIALCGKRGSGKDTVADYLVNNHGFTKVAFADPLKVAVKAIFGFNDDQLYGNKKEEEDPYWGATPRSIFQFVGNECFRDSLEEYFPNIGQDLWVKAMKRKLDSLVSSGTKRIVVSDLRYMNELEMLQKEFNTKVAVVVKKPSTAISGNSKYATHASECSLQDMVPSVVFENNSTFNSLYSQIDYFVESIKLI